MRKVVPERLENGRLLEGYLQSETCDGFYGAFQINGPCGTGLRIIVSGGDPNDSVSQGWEHVSVSTPRRPPNWQEMCFVKSLCWEPEECVIEFHPPESDYINNHSHCLHLWKPPFDVPLPPAILVGIKNAGIIKSEVEAIALKREIDKHLGILS